MDTFETIAARRSVKKYDPEHEMTRDEIQTILQLKDRKSFRKTYIKPALEGLLIEMTIPDKPNSRMQKYRLTSKGISFTKNFYASDSK